MSPQDEIPNLRFVPLLFIGLLLIFTFRLYGYSYFWLDDFNCLSQIQTQSLSQMLGHMTHPAADYYRPVGMLVYWIGFRLFDRDPFPYHCVLWAFHALNVGLAYVFLKRLTQSRAGASMGALLFASQPAFNDIFWNFGDIFEVTGQTLFLAGLLIWTHDRQSWRTAAGTSVVFLLALEAKETAITLPAICLMYELFLRRPLNYRRLGYLIPPAMIGCWYGWMKMTAMRSADRSQPYFMDLRWMTLGRGFGGYFNMLFTTNWRWQIWTIGFVVVLLGFAFLRNRLALFFQLYIFVAFLPLIFLVNHRDPFYWYFPIIGVCGLAALAAKAVSNQVLKIAPRAAVAPAAIVILALISSAAYSFTRTQTEGRRIWQRGIARDYAGFVSGIEGMQPPEPGETVFFTSMPQLFDTTVLRYATVVALHRPDLNTQLVDRCPENAAHCFRFEGSQLLPGR